MLFLSNKAFAFRECVDLCEKKFKFVSYYSCPNDALKRKGERIGFKPTFVNEWKSPSIILLLQFTLSNLFDVPNEMVKLFLKLVKILSSDEQVTNSLGFKLI